MGINLGNLAPEPNPIQAAPPVPAEVLNQPGVQQVDKGDGKLTLNLSKGVQLDLTKAAPTLKNAMVGLGWDVNSGGASMDLDVFAILLHNGKVLGTDDIVYFAQQDTGKGVRLSGDNRTGEGEGDDEKMFVSLDKVPSDVTSIAFFVNIYEAEIKGQNFGMVNGAYVRLVNEDTDKEECIYILNEEGGLYTAFHFANLVRNATGWSFETIGKGMHGDVNTIANQYC